MSTSLSATILEFLDRVFGADREEFLEDPEGYLAANGLGDLSCADFDDAMVSFFENAEFENERGDNNLGGNFHNTVVHEGQHEHEAIAEHLTQIVHEYGDTYITNNDNDVVNDSSFQGTIIAGGDVDFDFDNSIVSASGDGAVAAGDDIDGDVVTGDGSFVGDRNQVGDDSAFGDGANSGSISADDGGAVSVAGNNAAATGSNDDNRVDNSVHTEDSFNNDDSFNTDNSVETDVHVEVEIEESFNPDNSYTSSDDGDDGNSLTETGPGDLAVS